MVAIGFGILAAGSEQPVVVEVGLDTRFLLVVEHLRAKGAGSWWFTGDRATCLSDWWQAHPDHADDVWKTQMDYIDRERALIRKTYRGHTLATNPVSGRLTMEQIDERIRLRT
jgi:hypothetical protein